MKNILNYWQSGILGKLVISYFVIFGSILSCTSSLILILSLVPDITLQDITPFNSLLVESESNQAQSISSQPTKTQSHQQNLILPKPETLKQKLGLLNSIGVLEHVPPDNELNDDSINAVTKILKKNGNVVIIYLDDEDIEPPNHYRPMFEMINRINEDVDFELLNLELLEREDEFWGKEEYILVTLKQENSIYSSEIYYSDYIKVSSDFFKGINQILTDKGSSYRLFYTVIFCETEDCDSTYKYGENPVDAHQFGIIPLTQNQAEAIRQSDVLTICCREFDMVKTSEIERLINEYQKVGLFNGLSEDYIARQKDSILHNQLYDTDGIIYYFDTLFYNFDTETWNFENPYEEITLELINISRGKFQPTSIVDEYEYDTNSKYSFILGGDKYETTLENYSDWLDLSFMELMNRALSEQGIDGKFYTLDTGDQTATIVFFTQTQFKAVKEKDLMTLIEVRDSTAVEDGQEFEQQVIKGLQKENE